MMRKYYHSEYNDLCIGTTTSGIDKNRQSPTKLKPYLLDSKISTITERVEEADEEKSTEQECDAKIFEDEDRAFKNARISLFKNLEHNRN